MKKKQTSKETKSKKRKQETLQERVHRHLRDKNSEITDEDIKNVKTELEIRSEKNPESETEELEKPKNGSDSDKKNEQITLWNTLSDGYENDPEI